MTGPGLSRIAVVGGGPAGATCARVLASSGASVDLFEASPGAEKPCGGGIPSGVLREFPDLADPALSRRIVRKVVLYSPSDRRVEVTLDGGIHIFRRNDLDSFLRRKAVEVGATLHLTRVRSVHPVRGAGWELATDQGAAGPFDRVVAADGVRGCVRRALAGKFNDEHLSLALYAYVPGAGSGEMVLKFFGDFDGYLWVFPRTDHVSVGICAKHRSVQPARLEEELHRFIRQHYPEASIGAESSSAPGSSTLTRGYFIPASPSPAGTARRSGQGSHHRAFDHSGWALAGDAAGFVDPLTREGISWAMRSGAEIGRDLVTANELRTPELPRDLMRAHDYGSGFYRRGFLENTVRLASASPAIRAVLADLLTGDQGYRSLKSRLLRNALPCGVQVGMRALAGLLS
ncbi:MAG TPA: NAD(P)/FAD-dependent oxidoreductase [Patescibacteria group bacterium]|nr:NAD(P)/FAD-dependent oxidoreductase [Patescibacteria group bacterium]